ncbi:MAG: molecular chaperone DnaJ [Coriobacteriia bacterium]|nr:molecular chaperone DnaJ [Coriobacteriia bacterium]
MPSETKDLYTVLGVEKSATSDEIKKAFRRKARELHPDVNKAADAEERFKEANEAYDVLSDPAKREQYDRFGTVGSRPGAPGPGGGFGGGYSYVDLGDIFGGGFGGSSGGGFGMGDLFSAFFGGTVGGGSARRARAEGRDMAMRILVTLQEAAVGVDREIVLDRLATCEECAGTGAAAGSEVKSCPECNGTGQKVTVRRTFIGSMQTAAPCENCGATGEIIESPCEECAGSGRIPDRQHVTVTVPAGIRDGQQIRLREMGEAGIRGAAAGDLLVTVRIKPDEYLHREGDDLHCQASISITQAALGAEIKVPGVLEENEVRVSAGTQHGSTIRQKGQGMPRLNSQTRGDLIVHVAVQVPKKLTKKQRELMTQLAEEFGDDATTTKNPLEKLRDWLTG